MSLQHLTLGLLFNSSLEAVTLPESLQTLTFGLGFDQPMEGVRLPSNLQTLTFGWNFNQSFFPEQHTFFIVHPPELAALRSVHEGGFRSGYTPVSYTHLTLPTKLEV